VNCGICEQKIENNQGFIRQELEDNIVHSNCLYEKYRQARKEVSSNKGFTEPFLKKVT